MKRGAAAAVIAWTAPVVLTVRPDVAAAAAGSEPPSGLGPVVGRENANGQSNIPGQVPPGKSSTSKWSSR